MIAGVGGIGSPTAFLLAKLGCSNLVIFDPDRIEKHNLPSQMFRRKDVGKAKVVVLSKIIKQFTGLKIEVYQEKFSCKRVSPEVLIVAVDSMEERQKIWDSVQRLEKLRLLIDARMGGEIGRIIVVRMDNLGDKLRYERNFYSDDEALPQPCTAQSISYNTFMIASLICSLITRFARREELPKEIILDTKRFSLIKVER